MTTTTTGTDEAPIAPQPVAAPPKKNVFERFAGVLFAPAETFEEIVRRPDVLAPLVIYVILGFISAALLVPRMDTESLLAQQREAIRKQSPNISEADLEQFERIGVASAKVIMWASPLLSVFFWIVIAGVLFLAFRMMGGGGTFEQAVSVTLYAWLPMTILGILGSIVALLRGSFDPAAAATLVKSNPAFLVDMKEQPVLFSLLSSVDLFTIWMLILLIFGFAAVSKFSRAKSAAIVIALWLAFLVVKVGFAALGAARMQA